MRKISSAIIGLSWILLTTGAYAASMTVSPTTVTYVVGSNALISVNWNITTNGNGGGQATSPNGVYTTDTSVANVGATQVPLTSFATGGASISVPSLTSGTFAVPESFTIPQAVILYAQSNNLTTIYYSRDFSAGAEGYTTPSFIQINLTYQQPSLTVMPSLVNYLSANIIWNITTYGDGSGTITSQGGIFTSGSFSSNQTPLGTTSSALISPGLPATGTSIVAETIQIPASVLAAAKASGLRTIYFSRFFDRDPCIPQSNCYYGTNAATVAISLVAPNPNAALELSRVALRFSDNTSVKVIPPETSLMAIAEVSYLGSGLFDAMWEIAEPVSTIGQPVFVAVLPVRQFLTAGGIIYLQSPPLPTQKQGLHIVRLKLNQPLSTLSVPILQYSVNPQGDMSGIATLPPIRIHTPVDNALLVADTRFDWQAVKNARAYQLELFLPEQSGLKPDDAAISKRAPASGVMVPAKKNSLTLGELSRNKLRPNTTYFWRVIAIGEGGRILSTSTLREIRIP